MPSPTATRAPESMTAPHATQSTSVPGQAPGSAERIAEGVRNRVAGGQRHGLNGLGVNPDAEATPGRGCWATYLLGGRGCLVAFGGAEGVGHDHDGEDDERLVALVADGADVAILGVD